MGPDIVAGERLKPDQRGDDVAVIERQVDRGSGKSRVDTLIEPLTRFDKVALDENLFAEFRIVVDRSAADNRVAIGTDARRPIPVSASIGCLQKNALTLSFFAARWIVPGIFNPDTEAPVFPLITQVKVDRRAQDFRVLAVGGVEKLATGCRARFKLADQRYAFGRTVLLVTVRYLRRL
jgi:hypothetical protein